MKQDQFWEFKEGEAPLQRALRTVTACSLGYKPQKPFGVCDSCPATELCIPITKGILAAAKYKLETRKCTAAEARIEELQLELTRVIIQRNLARQGRREQADRAAYLSKELAQAREDGIWCSRCGEVFHDKDMTDEPTKFWTCPYCFGIQHRSCRGPLEEIQPVKMPLPDTGTWDPIGQGGGG